MEMVKIIDNCLTRGKVAKIVLLVLVLFILILTILPQNVLAEETRRVNASDILENITRGAPVEYTDCIIIGDLDISDWRKDLEEIEVTGIPRRVVESPIEIRYSTIQGNVNFNPIYFNNTVVFDNVIFEDSVSFFYAVFDKTTVFQDSTFKNKANFGEATFNEGAHFSRVKFNYAWFWNATFNNYTSFGSTTFDGRTTFCNAIFVKEASFYNCTFNEFTDFFNATFNNLARFQWAAFNGPVSFKNATFNDTANFPDVKFNDEAHFQNARFNDTTEFGFAKFKDRAYFTNASFEDNADFSEADIFLTMKIGWSQLEGKLVYNDYFYQSLIRNFETLGQSDDANDAYYKYKVEKRRHINIKSPLGFIKRVSEYIFLDRSCGYGVKPLRPPLSGIVVILVFSFGYYQTGAIKQTCSKVFPKTKNRFWKLVDKHFLKNHKRYKNALYFSASTFLALSYGDWYPTAKFLKIRKVEICRFQTIAIAEVFLGWIILVLFVISLTMTWIR